MYPPAPFLPFPLPTRKPVKKKGGLEAPRDHMFGLFATGYRNRAEDILAPTVDLQHDGTPLAALARHYL